MSQKHKSTQPSETIKDDGINFFSFKLFLHSGLLIQNLFKSSVTSTISHPLLILHKMNVQERFFGGAWDRYVSPNDSLLYRTVLELSCRNKHISYLIAGRSFKASFSIRLVMRHLNHFCATHFHFFSYTTWCSLILSIILPTDII